MNDLEREQSHTKEQKKKDFKKFVKNLLIVVTVVVVVVLALILTNVVHVPKYNLINTFPFIVQQVKQKEENQEEPMVEKTTKVKNEIPTIDYLEFDEFNFDFSLQGNRLGNLLSNARGCVSFTNDRIFYSVENKGIYRFNPETEEYVKIEILNCPLSFDFRFINVIGDYVYFVDANTDKVYKSTKAGNSSMIISSGITFLYGYDDTLYFIDNNNSVGTMDTNGKNKTILYTAESGSTISFSGISLSRLFITVTSDLTLNSSFYTINIEDKNDFAVFQKSTNNISKLQIENGYMYYYLKNDENTELCRQKFGSENVVKLVDLQNSDYPVVSKNRLYYGKTDNQKYNVFEINMNTNDSKTMVRCSNVESNNKMSLQCGGQYIFAVGNKNATDNFVFKGSCIYTPYSNDLTLKGEKWKY